MDQLKTFLSTFNKKDSAPKTLLLVVVGAEHIHAQEVLFDGQTYQLNAEFRAIFIASTN